MNAIHWMFYHVHNNNNNKYVHLGAGYIFELIAVETLGVFNASARHLLNDLGRRISLNSGEARETNFWDLVSGLRSCELRYYRNNNLP